MLDHHDGMRLESWPEIKVMLAAPHELSRHAPYVYSHAEVLLEKPYVDRKLAVMDVPGSEIAAVRQCSESVIDTHGFKGLWLSLRGVKRAAREIRSTIGTEGVNDSGISVA